jgi:hypothetical protein
MCILSCVVLPGWTAGASTLARTLHSAALYLPFEYPAILYAVRTACLACMRSIVCVSSRSCRGSVSLHVFCWRAEIVLQHVYMCALYAGSIDALA